MTLALPIRPTVTDLADLVSEIAGRPELWRPVVRFAESRYWTKLPGPSGIDVWLLTWLPDQGTELHDHGESAAAFTVVSGGLTELRATPAGDVSKVALHGGQLRTVEPGVVHDVHNDGYEPAISIHAYGPRLSRMTYYRLSDTGLTATRTVLSDEPEEQK